MCHHHIEATAIMTMVSLALLAMAIRAKASSEGVVSIPLKACEIQFDELFGTDGHSWRCDLASLCNSSSGCGQRLDRLLQACEGRETAMWDEGRNRSVIISDMVGWEVTSRCGIPCYEAFVKQDMCDGCEDQVCVEATVAIYSTCTTETFWEFGEEKLIRSRAEVFTRVCRPGGCSDQLDGLMNCMVMDDNTTGGGTFLFCNASNPCHQVAAGVNITSQECLSERMFEDVAALLGSCGCLGAMRALREMNCTENPEEMCADEGACSEALGNAEAQCEGGPFGRMIMEMTDGLSPLCRHLPCVEKLLQLQEVCEDPADMCHAATRCGQVMQEIREECSDLETLPELGSLMDVCNPCLTRVIAMMSPTSPCASSPTFCEPMTACSRMFGEVQTECRAVNPSDIDSAIWGSILPMLSACGGEECLTIPHEIAARFNAEYC